MDSRILKVIIAVAALHVLVLGSIFVINHGCKKTQPEMAKAELPPAPPIPPAPPSVPPPGSVQQPSPEIGPPPTQPIVTPPAPPAPPATAKSYTVKQGDTLGKIASAEGVSLNNLTAANPGLDPKKLKVGQELHIPAGTGEAATAGTESVEKTGAGKAAAGGGTYLVKKGDTLAKIAKAKGTTVTALKKANSLSTDTIRIGQKLKVPSPSESGQRPSHEGKTAKKESGGGTVVESTGATHVVQAGETPAVIAKKYGITTKALLAANGNLDPKRLRVGQKLVIPGKSGETPAPAPTETAQPAPPPVETPATDTSAGGVSGSAVVPPMPPAETPAPAPPVN